ncbi:MAG: 16S rRNA (guanine(527)-N(7))-methyltransferase RsmG [Bacteroidetes bacterium]|nr:16S rRNA (guanine(527)-N(7))-methyltransferase RsmG [Bacteroidota bacterium]
MNPIFPYFPELTKSQQLQFEKLAPLYAEWNARINVISRKDIDHLYERHVLHSLGIAKIISFKKGTRVLDVGTGGGFPGIPLAIMFPDVKFHLIDSIGKKIKVVNAIVNEIGLKNTTTEQARAETLKGSHDFIVSRAVTALPEFYDWVKHLIRKQQNNLIPNGILYLKGGDMEKELSSINGKFTLYRLNDYFEEPFFESKLAVHIY